MSFISDFFDGVKDNVLPAIIAGAAGFFGGPGASAFAWKAFGTVAIAGGVSRALAKDPEASNGGASDVTVSTRNPTQSRRLIYGKRRVGGTIVYTHATQGGSVLHYIIALCDGPIEAIDEIYFNDEVAVQANGTVVSKYSGIVQLDKKLGTANQTASSLAVQETPDTGNGAWTNGHRLRGVAYVYVELSFDRDKFPQGTPNISAVVRGRNDIDDPRDSSTGYTTNPALVLKHYIENVKFGFGVTVDDTTVQTAADVCDEQVSLKGGGTENRYTINGIVDSADEPATILNDICNSMAGWVTFTGGQWRMQAGEHRTPVMELTEDHMLSELSVTTRASRRERFNSVRGTFVSSDNDYQPADFPAYKDTSAITEDNGETIWQDIELPYTATASMAQRLARIDVERMRREILVEGLFDLSALQLIAGDVIELTDDQFGWDKKQFEVVDMDTDFSESPGVSLTLRETDSGVYDWSSGDEQESVQAPETDFPDPFTVSAPTTLTLNSGDDQLFTKKDGTIVSRIKATWNQSGGAFVDHYQVQYKKSSDSDWQNANDVDDDNRVAWIWDVEDDVLYDVRARAVNQLGIRSGWQPETNHMVEGKSTPPPNPETFNVTALSDGTREFTFTISDPPADLAGFDVRFIAGSSTDYDAMESLTPQGRLVHSPFESNQVPSGLHSFGVKPVDTSGNYSDAALFIEADLPLPRLAGVLLQRFEKSLGWPGTLNDMFKDTDNNLYAVAAADGEWADSGPDWASAGPEWYSWTNRESPVSYESEVMDLGSDATFTVRAQTSGEGSITKEMKTGTDADGDVTGSYGALGSVTARYVQVRITVSGVTPILRNLTTLLDGEVEQTVREDVDTSIESSVWFNKIATGHFQVAASEDTGFITRAKIVAFQSVTVPHTWSLESKSETVNGNAAAEFKIFDNNGDLADATIDVELNGPKAS